MQSLIALVMALGFVLLAAASVSLVVGWFCLIQEAFEKHWAWGIITLLLTFGGIAGGVVAWRILPTIEDESPRILFGWLSLISALVTMGVPAVALTVVEWQRFLPYTAAMAVAVVYFAVWFFGSAFLFALSAMAQV